MAARKQAGRYIKFKHVVKLLKKDNENKDLSKKEHEAVLENQKGKQIQKGRIMGIRACQGKDTKQNAGNSIMNVRNDQITTNHKYKILIGLLVWLFSLMANTSQLYFPQDILYKFHSNPV